MPFSQHYHDESERRRWQNPEEILRKIGLREGDTFVDIGCGEGFFAIVAAKMVGPNGKVFGIDLNENAIIHLRERCEREGLRNASFKVGRAEEEVLCNDCADFVFFGIDLHDFEDPRRVLRNAKEMLKPSGKLIDLDWKKKWMRKGPPVWMRFSEEYAARLIESAGFRIESIEDSGKMHYLIVAIKE